MYNPVDFPPKRTQNSELRIISNLPAGWQVKNKE